MKKSIFLSLFLTLSFSLFAEGERSDGQFSLFQGEQGTVIKLYGEPASVIYQGLSGKYSKTITENGDETTKVESMTGKKFSCKKVSQRADKNEPWDSSYQCEYKLAEKRNGSYKGTIENTGN